MAPCGVNMDTKHGECSLSWRWEIWLVFPDKEHKFGLFFWINSIYIYMCVCVCVCSNTSLGHAARLI